MFESYVIRSRLAHILDLLARERRMVLSGAFNELESLTQRRAAAMEAIAAAADETWGRHADLIRRIGVEAERNRRLMEACLKGAAAADLRLKEIAASHRQLGVYTPSGKRLAAPETATARERRS